MKQILLYPDKILRLKTALVEKIDNQLLSDIEEIKEVLNASDNGAGLAATQIGIRSRIFGSKDPQTKKIKIMVNPKIIGNYGDKIFPIIENDNGRSEDFLEGCLSFPDYYGTVKRFLKIKVEWYEVINNKLVKHKEILNGFDAIVFQHEYDHLDGIVFVDRIKEDSGKFYKMIGKKMAVWDVNKVISGIL